MQHRVEINTYRIQVSWFFYQRSCLENTVPVERMFAKIMRWKIQILWYDRVHAYVRASVPPYILHLIFIYVEIYVAEIHRLLVCRCLIAHFRQQRLGPLNTEYHRIFMRCMRPDRQMSPGICSESSIAFAFFVCDVHWYAQNKCSACVMLTY